MWTSHGDHPITDCQGASLYCGSTPLDKSSLVISWRIFLKNWVIHYIWSESIVAISEIVSSKYGDFYAFLSQKSLCMSSNGFFKAKWQIFILNKCWLGWLKTLRLQTTSETFKWHFFFIKVDKVPQGLGGFQTSRPLSLLETVALFPSPPIRVNWALLLARRLILCILLPCFCA